ncbi:hypothetical protein ACFE04_022749 [Oxalis oulophora]
MPSSPKLFHARVSPFSTTSSKSKLLIISCLTFGIAGFIFGLTAVIYPANGGGYRCAGGNPRSVRVVWDKSNGNGKGNGNGVDSDNNQRHKVMGFVGIQTGFGSDGRRKSLRKTWMPSDRQGLERSMVDYVFSNEIALLIAVNLDDEEKLEEATGLAFRFVIGKTSDKSKMFELKKEVAEYDDFVLLDIEEEYSKLPYKTLAFFKAAYALFDAEFYVKADDDIYLRPDRLSLLLAKDRSHSQTYLGCMKKGPVFTDPKLKWLVFTTSFSLL